MWSGVHPKVRKLLLRRFILATCQCYYLEYKLMAVFLLYLQFDFFNPINYLSEVVSWTVHSIFAWSSLYLLMMIVIPYGMLLCHMHFRMPTCHISWEVYVTQEIPLKFSLMLVLINSSYHSSWFYLRYLDEMDLYMDLSLTNQYLMVSSIFCGFYHFLIEHCGLDCEVWPVPMRLQKITPLYVNLMKWPNFWHAFKKVVVPMSILAAYYSPSWQLFCISCFLSTLITAQLHEIKSIYGEIMLRKLPMTLRYKTRFQHGEMELPLIVALSTTSLHGFEMQVAKDFHDIMASTRNKECYKMFKLVEFKGNHNRNWKHVRDILLGRITYFMRQLELHLKINRFTPSDKTPKHRNYNNMRSLVIHPPAPVPTRYNSRRIGNNYYNHPPCQPFEVCQPSESKLWLCQKQQLLKLNDYCSNLLDITAKKWSSKADLELELRNGLSFIWLIQGLVCICIRSVKEDKSGILQADLSPILQVLINLEKLLSLANECKENSSDSLTQLLAATSRSINRLIYHFNPCFDVIVKDQCLLNELQSRP